VKILIENFKTIKQLSFTFDRKPGVYFIRGDNRVNKRMGSNGAGKSSIFDALCWCLYGKTPDGRRGPDIKPWDGAKPTSVTLTIGDHSLLRSQSPNKLSWNDKVVDQDTVDQHIGMAFETFINTQLLAQSQPLFFDRTPTEKMHLFNDVLNLDRWALRSKAAGKKADELQGELDHVEGWLESFEQRKRDNSSLLKQAKADATEWDKRNQQDIAVISKAMPGLIKDIAKLQDQHDVADLAYDGAMTELKAIDAPLQKLVRERRILERVLDQAKHTAEIAVSDADMVRKDLKAAKGGRCPFCGGPLKSDEHLAALRSLLKKHIAKQTVDPKLAPAIEAIDNKVANILKANDQFKAKAEAARDTLDQLIPRLAELKAKKSHLDARLKAAKGEANPYNEQIQKLRGLASKLNETAADKKKRAKILGRRIARTRYWVKGFKDVELYLIDDVLRELEIASCTMLEQLGLVGWAIHYATETETKAGTIKRGLAVFIKSPHNDEAVRWECWSGGEQQRLKIAGALALSEVLLARAGINPKFEILDEPSSHMSSEGVDDLCEFLAARATQLQRAIFFADQTVIESSLFRGTIAVTKTRDRGTIIT
jgi:DNA repair exonuclease SbcCD ATPase subunit